MEESQYETCKRLGHKIYDQGGLWFCYVCHMRTDDAFAAHSRELLERFRVKTEKIHDHTDEAPL